MPVDGLGSLAGGDLSPGLREKPGVRPGAVLLAALLGKANDGIIKDTGFA